MNELEKELEEIMATAMSNLDNERLSHQEKVIEMLENNMYEENGTPELAELYGIIEVAQGAEKIAEFMEDISDKQKSLVDATINTDPCGVVGLMRVVHCGNGTDIYEPLRDMSVQIGMHEYCHGLMIRVPITGTAKENKETTLDGVVTCLALENTIGVVVRLGEHNATIKNTRVFDVATYTLGKPENKLIDAVYLAYFMPRYLKEHSAEFYASVLVFNEWRNNKNGE